MFTGIIKEIAKVERVVRGSSSIKLSVKSEEVYKQTQVSDSIAINGTCLTVTEKKNNLLIFDAISSTLANTNLKRLKKGDCLNLESALSVGDKLGGHFVLGHVDCELKLKRIVKKPNSWQLYIELPSRFRKYVLENGSIAVEGISLTVKKVLPKEFSLDIIPFTFEHTNLKYKKIGDRLNIEFDYLLKKSKSSS